MIMFVKFFFIVIIELIICFPKTAIFIFYVLYFEGMMNLFETFYVATRLHKYILAGDLNNYLIRPLGVGFQYMLASSRIRPFFTSIAFFICLIVYVIVSDITFSLSRLFPTLLFSIIAGLTMISVIRFTDSFSFFFKQPVSIRNIYSRMAHVYNRFPGVIFTGGLRKLAMMFPNVYFGAFAIHYLFGFSDLSTLYLQTGILLILLLISFVGTLLIWKVGMRNYEAYN